MRRNLWGWKPRTRRESSRRCSNDRGPTTTVLMMQTNNIHINNRRSAHIAITLQISLIDISLTHIASDKTACHTPSATVRSRVASTSATVRSQLLLLVQELAESTDARAGEDAEDVALVVIKFRGRFAAEGEEVFAQEGLHAG